jgi:nucleoside-triphosphatase THEP1
MAVRARLILWTGPKHSGKTTAATRLVDRLRAEGLTVAGILAPSVRRGGELVGFDVVDLSTGRRAPLLRRARPGSEAHVGIFAFRDEGLRLGRAALDERATVDAHLVIIDEFGPLELAGGGWRPAVDALIAQGHAPLMLIVRERLLERVAETCRQGCPRIDVLPADEPASVDRVLDTTRPPR